MTRDVVVIGGGFYGCCIALYMRSLAEKVTIIEAEDDLLTRASFNNQARIHTGFHYPRSFVTAKRSLQLYSRFIEDFLPAVNDNFRMLYAIARYGSKVSSRRFADMYRNLGAPFAMASAPHRALFSEDTIEEVFECDEFAFDALILRELLRERLLAAGVEIVFGARALDISPSGASVSVELADGRSIRASYVFNAAYSGLNHIRVAGAAPSLPIKNELTEVAIIEPPPSLDGLGVTVLDGPFFSVMPFPALDAYSLTHVRYTPQDAWTEPRPDTVLRDPAALQTRWLHMARDAERYLRCASEFRWRTSLFEVKTVLQRNEIDDGRPIFIHRHAASPRIFSVLGGKLDNIYDLIDVLAGMEPEWAGLDMRWFKKP